MLLLYFAPFAILVELDFASDKLFVFARPVVDALACSTGQFDEFILRHLSIF